MTLIYNNQIPRDIRKAAVRAIKKGVNLEAVAEHNRVADQINKTSFYEAQVRKHIVQPFEFI